MKVERFNTIRPLNINKLAKTNPKGKNFSGISCDIISFRADWSEGRILLSKITGSFSKEELRKAEDLQKTFQNFSTDKSLNLKQDILSQSINMLKAAGIKYKQENHIELFDYNPLFISNELKDKLKKNALKIYTLNRLMLAPALSMQNELSEFSETLIPLSHSIFEHPADKVLRITGGFTKENKYFECRIKNKYSGLRAENIFRKKINVIETMQNFFQGNINDFSDGYSDKDFTRMKKLAIEYSALNNLQKDMGCYTKDLERVIYSSQITSDIKAGNNIDGLGTVINRLKVDNRDAIIVLSDINKSKMLRMYNLEEMNKNAELKFSQSRDYSIEELNELNNKAKDLTQKEKNIMMSEIRFRVLPSKAFSEIPTKDKTVKEILDKYQQIYYMSDFINYDTKKYSKAAKIIALQLIKLFSEKKCYPIFLRAQAFNNSKHSPLNFYKFYGFTPFSHTEEEIEKITLENNGRFPYDIPVYMYLQNFDTINNRLKLWQSVYSI